MTSLEGNWGLKFFVALHLGVIILKPRNTKKLIIGTFFKNERYNPKFRVS
jgi:hypothetical protein